MRQPIPLQGAALWGVCCPVLPALIILVLGACSDRDDVLEPARSPSTGGVPPEVIHAAKEAGGRDGHVLFLKEINPKTGAVVRGKAEFVPFSSGADTFAAPADSGRSTAPRGAAGTIQTQPADHPNPYVIIAPSGLHLPPTYPLFKRDSATRNSLNTFCYYNGQWHQNTDFYVDSLIVTAVANTGGHEDAGHAGPKPKGRTSRANGPSDGLGEWPFTYYADSAAGDDHLLFYYTVNDTDQPATCRGPKPPGAPYVFAKRWPELIRIEPRAGLAFGDITSAHFDIFYATPFTASLLPWVVELYQRNYPSGILRVTAGSLIYGGLHDWLDTWRPPHNRHRIGTDVDLNAAPGGGGRERLEAIRRFCFRSGFVHAEIEEPRDTTRPPDHTHCYHFVGYTGG